MQKRSSFHDFTVVIVFNGWRLIGAWSQLTRNTTCAAMPKRSKLIVSEPIALQGIAVPTPSLRGRV